MFIVNKVPPHTTHSLRQVCNIVLAITLREYNLFTGQITGLKDFVFKYSKKRHGEQIKKTVFQQ
jgi:hypothetical protein